MNNIIIRPENKEDYFDAEYMTKRAFWNLHHPGCDEHYLVHLFRQSEDYIEELSRVAEVDGKIVGGIYYSKAYIMDGDKKVDVLNFGPLCVDPDYQNQGIGGKLLGETIKLAREKGYKGIVIFGEPLYYPKHGFKTCDHFGITTKDGKNYDAFMGYEIVPDAFFDVKGKFYESEVFEQLYPDKVEEYDKNFPYMEKLKLPGQWD
ncbi:GNAT family N-acetyltransferase [Anaeromicropila herbilytica]|uniref:N-acetyltransferase n=1 Tax=Anaeromicropila herbilytica TaxID=2785025 RepID=A0A7R7IF10_9FIRM|nr:N-acetyltransferase [Anaeromicropila herbilytica]BCN32689.1 N-acetyltransferase [Anaeromicropila herbilytica]